MWIVAGAEIDDGLLENQPSSFPGGWLAVGRLCTGFTDTRQRTPRELGNPAGPEGGTGTRMQRGVC